MLIEIDDTPMKLVMNNSRISNDLLDSTFTENNSICFDEVSPLKEVEYSVGLLSPDNEAKSRSNESHLDDVEFIEMDKDCLSVDQEYSWYFFFNYFILIFFFFMGKFANRVLSKFAIFCLI